MNPNQFLPPDVCLIVPALNEEDSIQLVLRAVPKNRLQAMIVVDNGSSDHTGQRAAAEGADVVIEPQRGYGRACLTGIDYALDRYRPSILAFLDADYSDDPQELTSLLTQIDAGADFVLGSRFLGKAERGSLLLQARFGNWLATRLSHLLFKGPKLSDLGPFRAIRLEAYQKLGMRDEDFGWTIEMQVKAILEQLDIREMSVSYRRRVGVSKITGTITGALKAGFKILWTIFWLWFYAKLLNRPKSSLKSI